MFEVYQAKFDHIVDFFGENVVWLSRESLLDDIRMDFTINKDDIVVYDFNMLDDPYIYGSIDTMAIWANKNLDILENKFNFQENYYKILNNGENTVLVYKNKDGINALIYDTDEINNDYNKIKNNSDHYLLSHKVFKFNNELFNNLTRSFKSINNTYCVCNKMIFDKLLSYGLYTKLNINDIINIEKGYLYISYSEIFFCKEKKDIPVNCNHQEISLHFDKIVDSISRVEMILESEDYLKLEEDMNDYLNVYKSSLNTNLDRN